MNRLAGCIVGGGQSCRRRSYDIGDGKSTEATTMTEGEWEDSRATRGLDQDRRQDPPGAAAGRGPGVPTSWERPQ